MELEEAKKILEEIKNNCIDKGRTYYKDDKRVQKARAIEIVLDTLDKYENQLDLDYVDKNYISKEKIRAKIKYLKEYGHWRFFEDRDLEHTLRILQELLKEGESDEND